MKLGLITTTFQHTLFLWDCFYSVLAQREQDFVHVIVDDASTDNPMSRIEPYRQRHPERTIVVRRKVNGGPAVAFNDGVRALPPDCDWIMKCDADDKIDARLISECYEVIRQQPAVNVIVAPARHFGTQHHVYRYPTFDPRRMIETCMIPGQAMYRRSLWDALGGYDETMRSAEDWDFFVRAQLGVGLTVHQLPAPRWYYRMHAGPRASHAGMSQIKSLQAYWRGHRKDNLGQRTWASWLQEQGKAA
jgi:glycosyltransferase involved in cell wall biosynthesis